ncbi:hypothetical protein [Sphingobacterium detergens]|uniref:ASCH domain-containing protein n=1 Tax=Sphingobacterium detergens TaxID=1145106 RepID=A0A420AB99_SPHD1|nr:hypothetical protein [Sphingobacterium detergens]RKE41767.1 hypothetical protein DFQ12_5751 [Sphingobacterium detergens]
MLFKEIHLAGIKSGKITLAFRQWKQAAVKSGTLLKTSVGLVEIGAIETVDESAITDQEAVSAGFKDKNQLLKSFRQQYLATIFRIAVRYHSEDPRVKLREGTELSEEQFVQLKIKIARLDTFSKQGPWTRLILSTIRENPNLHAIGIARLLGFEKEWLKLNIRKLKNLGLTISHTVGYEISPLGEQFIQLLEVEEQ